MRILMLAPNPGARGAIPRHTPLLVDALNSLGCDVVLEPWGRRNDQESVPRKVFRRFRDIASFRRVLRTERFDLLVVKTSHEWPSLLQGLPLLCALRGLVPTVVVQFHGGHSERLVQPGHVLFKLVSAVFLYLTDGVLLLSSAEVSATKQFHPRQPAYVVCNPFVPSAHSTRGDPSRPADPPEFVLLFVGRLIREKGIFEMLDSFDAIRKLYPCRLLVVGDGPCAAELGVRIAGLGLTDKVVLTGYLTGQELQNAYRSADVFVLPSYTEGFPTAIAEALAAGLPIVTTRIRGMADHLADEDNALFVVVRDVTSLTLALERILADEELRHRMGDANLTKISQFAPLPVAQQYLEALTRIQSASRSSAPRAGSATARV